MKSGLYFSPGIGDRLRRSMCELIRRSDHEFGEGVTRIQFGCRSPRGAEADVARLVADAFPRAVPIAIAIGCPLLKHSAAVPMPRLHFRPRLAAPQFLHGLFRQRRRIKPR